MKGDRPVRRRRIERPRRLEPGRAVPAHDRHVQCPHAASRPDRDLHGSGPCHSPGCCGRLPRRAAAGSRVSGQVCSWPRQVDSHPFKGRNLFRISAQVRSRARRRSRGIRKTRPRALFACPPQPPRRRGLFLFSEPVWPQAASRRPAGFSSSARRPPVCTRTVTATDATTRAAPRRVVADTASSRMTHPRNVATTGFTYA